MPKSFSHYYSLPSEGPPFHAPYPASPEEFLANCGVASVGIDQSQSLIACLPVDVLQTIFSFLRVVDLDSARFTCNAWWTQIMTSPWLLEKVLVPSSPVQHALTPSETVRKVRQLARQFDLQARLEHFKISTASDGWRLRYRKIEIEFSERESINRQDFVSATKLQGVTRNIESMAFWPESRTLTVLIKIVCWVQGDTSKDAMAKELVTYYIDFSGRPIYTCTVPCSESVAEISFSRVQESIYEKPHVTTAYSFSDERKPLVQGIVLVTRLLSNCDTWELRCQPNPQTGFTNLEPPIIFSIISIGTNPPSVGSDLFSPDVDALKEVPKISQSGWTWLSSIWPTYSYAAAGGERTNNTTIPNYYVAKVSGSESLHLVKLDPFSKLICHHTDRKEFTACASCGRVEDDEPYHLIPVLQIAPPRTGMVFQNVKAVLMNTLDTIRIAVIWQAVSRPDTRAELYLYAAQLSHSRLHSGSVTYSVPGRRIHSVPVGMAGLHFASPLKGLIGGDLLARLSAGGMEFISLGDSDSSLEPEQYQFLMYGQFDGPTLAKVTIFDFEYSSIDDIWAWIDGSGITCAGSNFKLQYGRVSCVCALHDCLYKVKLPEYPAGRSSPSVIPSRNDTIFHILGRHYRLIKANQKPPSNLNLFRTGTHDEDPEWLARVGKNLVDSRSRSTAQWLAETNVADQEIDRGTVETIISSARSEALERIRRRDVLVIQQLIRDGLSDEDISVVWFNSRRCTWNLHPKPEGWSELRTK